MAYDDKDIGRLFPTRTGDATGTANERKMLDAIDGSNQIRTRIQQTVEGSKVTTTRLRTRAGNPDFITEVTDDDEENEFVYMDSGAVDLLALDESNPDAYKDAPLFYGTLQQSYYVLKKLLGKIWPPRFKSRKPPVSGEAGKSFSIKLDDILRVDNQTEIVGRLYTKKFCAGRCPPSMFTGKCRLFVQAQFGAPLNMWKWELNLPTGLPPRLQHENGALVDTSTGIYRDSEYKHWLITVHSGGAIVRKLVREDKVKPLVRHLRNPDRSGDWDKIEAYILAYSKPSSSMVFNIGISDIPIPDMLGYGWKFNWDGNAADIIHHGNSGYNWSSTHYRLSINRDAGAVIIPSGDSITDERARWSVALSVVEGPVVWKNSRFGEVITHPDWLFSSLLIAGVTSGDAIASNAPVYCFYKRNSLEVFRYTRSGGETATRYKRVSDPPPFGLVCDWTADTAQVGMETTMQDLYSTWGTQGGYNERYMRLFNPTTAGFSCSYGSTVVSCESYQYERRALGGKTFGALTLLGSPVYSVDGCGDSNVWTDVQSAAFTCSDGVIAYGGSAVLSHVTLCFGAGNYQDGNPWTHRYGMEFQDGYHSEYANNLLLIPFYDAEVVYMRVDVKTTRTYDGWHGGYIEGYDDGWAKGINKDGVLVAYNLQSHTASWGSSPSGMITDTDVTAIVSEETPVSIMATASGAYSFDPPVSTAPFFAGTEYVDQQYVTSSAVGLAAFGNGARNRDGFPSDFDSEPPPFIGWA